MKSRSPLQIIQGRRSRHPSAEERRLWHVAMQDAEPLEGREIVPPPSLPPVLTPSLPTMETASAPVLPVRFPLTPARLSSRDETVAGLDHRLSERLRRGQLPIEGRIDLHGMTQDRARDALDRFLGLAWDQGLRAVLVITGKGSAVSISPDPWQPKPGILRANVPRWLNEQPHRTRVLAFSEAQGKHGGGGALYVLLRRRREP